jgi:DNA-binding NarL/FixJ family response regulator
MPTLKDRGLQRQGDLPSLVTEALRVLIIDDHVLVRAGLRILLENQPGIAVVGEVSHAAEAMTIITRERPDIILLDLDVATDLEVLPALHTITSGARVIVLTGMRDLESHRRAVRLGAIGLVRKEQASEVLIQAIAKVHAGEAWLDRALVASVLREITHLGSVQPADLKMMKIATLTSREREVITLVGQGLKNRVIAARLRIAEATVRHHLTSIFTKLSVVDRLDLVIYAYKHGLSHFSQ